MSSWCYSNTTQFLWVHKIQCSLSSPSVASQRKKLILQRFTSRDLHHAEHSMAPLAQRGAVTTSVQTHTEKMEQDKQRATKADVLPPSSLNAPSQINHRNAGTFKVVQISSRGREKEFHAHQSWGRASPWHWGILPFTDHPLPLHVEHVNYRHSKELWRRKVTDQGTGLFSLWNSKLSALRQKKAHLQLHSTIIIPNILTICSILLFLISWLNKYRILKYHLTMILFSEQKHQHFILYYNLL